MKFSIVVPVYNEEKTIIYTLKNLNKVFSTIGDYEIIVVNDNSNDSTETLLNNNKDLYKKLFKNEKNLGKGGAVKIGIMNAEGEFILFQDADDEYDPNDYLDFVKLIDKIKDLDLIVGSRFNYKNYSRSHYFFNRAGNFLITFLFNILNNTTFTDIYTCYIMFRKNKLDIKKIKTNGFEQQAEILSNLVKSGGKFFEVPINYNGRTHAEGKKIKFYHIFFVIYQIIICRIRK
jgi:glycosyltransferase involved in cell wall biosynthesis